VKILLCCEYYYPSVGGVQVVMQQLAERFAAKGHFVTIATSRLPARQEMIMNGVSIREFSVSGNYVSGMSGEVRAYQEFVKLEDFDVVMIKAAQQWTFDALWPVLGQIKSAKIFIPCGFSGLYEFAFADYFKQLPEILRRFDHLIFYASDYRDINFSKLNGVNHYSIIPNGASEVEFSVPLDAEFRKTMGILEEEFVFLTVGSLTRLKGHLELAKAFANLNIDNRKAVLILNGNKCMNNYSFIDNLNRKIRLHGIKHIVKYALKAILVKLKILVEKEDELDIIIKLINSQPNKRVLMIDLPRNQLVQAFMAADLFVFASNVEYSPLVLFETSAAGTPFLSVPVGNSEEIAAWTGAGAICPAEKDEKGYTRVEPMLLAHHMEQMMCDPNLLKRLGDTGKRNWQEKFTWATIAEQYENLFRQVLAEKGV